MHFVEYRNCQYHHYAYEMCCCQNCFTILKLSLLLQIGQIWRSYFKLLAKFLLKLCSSIYQHTLLYENKFLIKHVLSIYFLFWKFLSIQCISLQRGPDELLQQLYMQFGQKVHKLEQLQQLVTISTQFTLSNMQRNGM